jgi:Putative beta-barrel porin 2
MKVTTCALALLCALFGGSVSAAAQESEDPFETARFRFGAIRFTPAVEITSLGRDSNVFNEADSPKSDTTAAVGPTVQIWMRPGNTRLSGRFGTQYLYFREFKNQRAWNTSNELRWEFPLARLTPFIGGSYVNSKERQGYEIDSRSRRRDDSLTVGTKLRFSGKTELVATVERANAKYDESETFVGATLAEQLNRREERAELQFRYALTPLTTFVVRSEVGRDRFALTSLRNSESVRVMPGFEFKPFALISGQVFVGYRRFDPLEAALPDHAGVVASVNATYIRNSTRFQVKVDRDVAYSFAPTRPYYTLLDAGLTVTQRLRQPWDIVGRVSRQILAYQVLESAEGGDGPRDRGLVYGGGVGYLVGETLRLGMDVNYSTRRSEVEGRRDFEGLRVFGSITYGLRQ